MGWLGVTLKQVLTRVRAGGLRCLSDVIIVQDDTGWQGVGDVTHRKRAEVCVRIWRKSESSTRRQTKRFDFWRWTCALMGPQESGTRHQTRRIDFWSSQARGECAPNGGGGGGGRLSWGPKELDSIEDCVSPPYVETFNSKLIKRFRTWTRSYVFSKFRDSYVLYIFYSNEHYMSISPIVLIVNMIYIYIYIYIYTYIYMCVCVCVCVCIYIYIYM